MMRLVASCLVVLFVFTSSVRAQTLPASKPSTRPTTQRAIADVLAREQAHLRRVTDRLAKHPELAPNPYVQLEISVARRFLDRIAANAGRGDNSLEWRLLQTDEIRTVLNHTEKTMDDVDAGKLPPTGLGPVPVPTGGPVKIVDGVFVTDTKLPGESSPKPRPYYFGGYGHFDQVIKDIPNFRSLGASLIQDGRNGPAQGLAPDRTLTAAGRAIKDMLASAAKADVKVDILTSPHYFPAWAVAAAPDMQNGTPFNNIDHPKQREVIETWLKLLAAQNKDQPALLSYCLSNEPMYSSSGRDQYSAPAWHAFLKQRHGTIENLNKVYETTFKSFDDVPADGWPETPVGRRRAFDWVTFNDEHFAAWHEWMGDVLKKQDPRALTHAKIMVFFSLDYDKCGSGIDPEQFALATDIAGCDAYAQIGSGVGPLDESTSKEYAYHWQVEEMGYDLLHSFANQPVFNSENHPMPNATGAYRWPSKHTRANFWQGGLHHQGATTTWVWEEGKEDSLLHSIYFRPAHVWQQGRALLDLNRLSDEVTAINRATPTVAILYSPASRFWEKDYSTAVRTCYTALNFMGETVTFVSERQLAEGKVPPVRAVVLPKATHVSGFTTYQLRNGSRLGLKVIAYGQHCLAHDDYDRPAPATAPSHALHSVLESMPVVDAKSERDTAESLRKLLPRRESSAAAVTDKNGPAWGVEFRSVEQGGKFLVPVINLLKDPQTVTITLPGGEDEAVDLLSGEVVSLKDLKLQPMEPLLLKISPR